jgi:hypothetical protein
MFIVAEKTQNRDSFARLEMKQATQTGYELEQSSGQEKCAGELRVEPVDIGLSSFQISRLTFVGPCHATSNCQPTNLYHPITFLHRCPSQHPSCRPSLPSSLPRLWLRLLPLFPSRRPSDPVLPLFPWRWNEPTLWYVRYS